MVVEGLVNPGSRGVMDTTVSVGVLRSGGREKPEEKLGGNRCGAKGTKEEGTDLCVEVLLLRLWLGSQTMRILKSRIKPRLFFILKSQVTEASWL